MGDALRPPRPLSQRALIPMERARVSCDSAHSARTPLSLLAPLASSPVRPSFAAGGEERSPRPPAQTRSHTQPQARTTRPREHRHSPLSPLAQSPPLVRSPSPLPYPNIDERVVPRRPSRPNISDSPPPAIGRPRLQHMPTSFDSVRGDNGLDSSSEEEERSPTLFTTLNMPPNPRLDRELPAPPQQPTHQAKCLLCPEPCLPSQGLCNACTEHYRPQYSEFGGSGSGSDSDYEDIVVRTPSRTPSLSPQQKKPKPLSIQTTPQHSNTFTASPVPMTPNPTARGQHRSFSRPITPIRSPQHAADTPPLSSPRTPESPRGWSRRSTSSTRRPATNSTSGTVSSSPGVPFVVQQLKVLSKPTPRKVSVSSPVADRSALYHLERSMQQEDWEPLAPGERPVSGHDVVRVTSGAARRVVVRDSNDENADTMKMLVDQEVPERERRHEGGGGGYGDFFSIYAEKEEMESGQEADRRWSAGSSIYDRIQSIYDAYREEGSELDETEAGMF